MFKCILFKYTILKNSLLIPEPLHLLHCQPCYFQLMGTVPVSTFNFACGTLLATLT